MNFKRFHESKNLLDLTALINAPSGTFTTLDRTETFTADHLLEIQLKPNTYYKMSSNYVKTGTKLNIIYLQYADASKATTSTVSPSYKTNDTGVVKIAMYTSRDGADDFISGLAWVMLNEGDTALPYEPYSSEVWHDTPHYIMKTSTDTITTLPAIIYPNDTTATVGLKGNMEQLGTPTPSNPVDVQGVGERTENLLKNDAISTEFRGVQYTVNADKSITVYGTASSQISYFILMGDGTATNDLSAYTTPIFKAGDTLKFSSGSSIYKLRGRNTNGTYVNVLDGTVTLSKDLGLIYIQVAVGETADETIYPMITLSTETDTDYEPYGYKIPISSGGVTTNIYLGSTQTTRQIGKYTFDGSNIFTTQRASYRNNTAFFATTAMTGTGITNRPSINNYFVVPSAGTNPQSLDYACSGFHPSDLFSSYYYLRVPYDVIGMTDSNTDNEFITALNTWLSSLYNSGSPMIAYYALATPETAAVNEPLMKIGTYTDTLSNAASIPTTEGANSITVDTTVQPSEFTATWTGWHDATVKEWDGSQWNE